MRLIITGLFLILYLVLGSIYLGIEWIISKVSPDKSVLRQFRCVQKAFRVVGFLSGVKVHEKGRENIPVDEPVLYVANHRSIFDIVVAYPRCVGLTGFVSKISMAKVPLLNLFMSRTHCLFMDRDDIKQSLKIILQAIEQVKHGESIFIFPEGTRNKNREDATDVAEFKEGSFKIAQKGKCKIVPVAITGTAEIFENHLPWIHGGHVYLTFGEPVDISMLDKETQKRVGEYCSARVKEMLIEQQEQIKARQ